MTPIGSGNDAAASNAINSAGSGITTEAAFTTNVSHDSNLPNCAVQFIDTSTSGPTGWDWSFQDYSENTVMTTQFAMDENPVYTFGNGNFSIRLTVTNPEGTSTSAPYWINVSSGQVRPGLSLDGFVPYPGDTIYRYNISEMPVDQNSDMYMTNMGSAWAYPGMAHVYPINVVDNNISASEFDHISSLSPLTVSPVFQIPPGMKIQFPDREGDVDHVMYVINPDNNSGWFGYADPIPIRYANGMYWAGLAQFTDFKSHWLNPEEGSRMMPIVITRNESIAGPLTHISFMAAYEQGRENRWPGWMGTGLMDSTYAPCGAIIRLKQSTDISGYTEDQQNILNGWKHYGIEVTDNTGVWTEWGVMTEQIDQNLTWDVSDETFSDLHPSDFEVVDVSSLEISPDSLMVKSPPFPSFQANRTSGVAPFPVSFRDTTLFGPTSWSWKIANVTGNGTMMTISNSQSPSFTFLSGNWLVELTATNAYGSNITAGWINVSSGQTLPDQSNDGFLTSLRHSLGQ